MGWVRCPKKFSFGNNTVINLFILIHNELIIAFCKKNLHEKIIIKERVQKLIKIKIIIKFLSYIVLI